MSPNSQDAPYLSVVVTTRNDDHGGDPLKRLQAFVNCFDAQCRLSGLDAEVIVVEWNPPPERPRVSSLVQLPASSSCTYRFIEVPAEAHDRLRFADVLPLFQMIAKNVGIRRARGRFVLATNIDILFSNELVELLASGQLQAGCLYRVDRHDIEPNVPIAGSLDDQMAYCVSHRLRIHGRLGSNPVDPAGRIVGHAEDIVDGRIVALGDGWHVREGAGSGSVFRWASAVAALRVDSIVASQGEAVLQLDIESNPYDADSHATIQIVEDGTTLKTVDLVGRRRFGVALGSALHSGPREITLQVANADPEVRTRLPIYERRDSMYYRMYSATVSRMPILDPKAADYPMESWQRANLSPDMTMTFGPQGLEVASDRRKGSYCVRHGPFRAPQSGLHSFDLSCTMLEGGVNLGILSAGDRFWIPATITRLDDPRFMRVQISVDMRSQEECSLVVFNDHPEGDGVSRFMIHRLRGTCDLLSSPDELREQRRSGALRERRAVMYSKLALFVRGLRDGTRREAWKRALADRLASLIARLIGSRMRYRIARTSSEYQNLEQALRNSDEQLRKLAPLQDVADIHRFLHEHRPDNLHANGCGDFQLMAREHWVELRGYPEFETFSMNIDGLFSYIADAAGIREQVLSMPIYHLEHEVGSGWSPEGEALLRKRIAERGITWVDASTVYIWAAYMKWLGRPMIFNGSMWGLAESELAERVVGPASEQSRPEKAPIQHPIFHRFSGFDGWAEPGFERGFYGVAIRDWLFTGTSKHLADRREVHIGLPPVDEEYFEWIALLTAVDNASGRFCFAEIGAGWGRWTVSAAALCRQRSREFALIAIEPEPSHFDWLKMVLRDNDIDPDAHELFQAAAGAASGELLLAGPDRPGTEYGNRTIRPAQLNEWRGIPEYVFRSVASMTFETLFARHETIDLVDMDVQGSEYDIVAGSMAVMNAKVKLIHIATHSRSIERDLTHLFEEAGWLNAFSFHGQDDVHTPFGWVKFGDGVQTWVNRRWPQLHAALTR